MKCGLSWCTQAWNGMHCSHLTQVPVSHNALFFAYLTRLEVLVHAQLLLNQVPRHTKVFFPTFSSLKAVISRKLPISGV